MNLSQQKIFFFQFLEKILGKDFIRKLYTYWNIKAYNKRGAIFIHIPKAGGTSITKNLYGKRIGHAPASLIKSMMGEKKFSSFFSFTVTRNPYDRLVSSYHYAVQGGGSEGGIRNREKYLGDEFKSFEGFVKKWLINQQQETLDVIFLPQWHFVCDNRGRLLLNWVGRMEDFLEVENQLRIKLGVTKPMEKRNYSVHEDYKCYYNDELKALVYNYYKVDFELFGYKKDFN